MAQSTVPRTGRKTDVAHYVVTKCGSARQCQRGTDHSEENSSNVTRMLMMVMIIFVDAVNVESGAFVSIPRLCF